MLKVLRRCQRELEDLPLAVREDLADAVARLEEGHTLSMPLSRPMPSIGKGVHELRFRDRSGIYRVVYVFAKQGNIYLLHAFKKTSQQTPQKSIEISRKRLKEIL